MRLGSMGVMATLKAFIARHPVPSYFALTFTISWGGLLLVIGGPSGMTGVKAQNNPLFPLALAAMVAGPSVTGILLTAAVTIANSRQLSRLALRGRVA